MHSKYYFMLCPTSESLLSLGFHWLSSAINLAPPGDRKIGDYAASMPKALYDPCILLRVYTILSLPPTSFLPKTSEPACNVHNRSNLMNIVYLTRSGALSGSLTRHFLLTLEHK